MGAPKEIKILVVDDFSMMRKIVINILAELGYNNVQESANGEEAFQLLVSQGDFGLLITDWHMPKMNGLELLQKVRGNPTLSKLPDYLCRCGKNFCSLCLSLLLINSIRYLTVPRVDLHMHSVCSDGTDTPAELMEMAGREKIAVVSLTDHDTLKGIPEAMQSAEELGIRLIPGIELSAKSENGSMHILGYQVDIQNPELNILTENMRIHRSRRNSIMLERLRSEGIDITEEELITANPPDTVIGRPHIARLMIEKSYVSGFQEAFYKYLGNECPAFVSKEIYNYREIINTVKQSGGMVFLAHPITLMLEEDALFNLLKDMKDAGLDGVEIWNSSQKDSLIKVLREYAAKLDLMMSGGSDFHGHNKNSTRMGKDYYGNWLTQDLMSPSLFE
ncbi:hypothetical protein CHS0354_035352 [Potamilus streckersoni]|uniref:Response regulatory domain-containing protein n=1 Tax=Potamilus streckersoni TaxID=2493646 RepID=A0AAE0S2P5_9BIVA|nr:hypothetical protein CHS0354_035352 [Potamilus streckersoni]